MQTITGIPNFMARTIRTKVFKFNELNGEAKQIAINEIRNSNAIDSTFIYDEAYKSIKAFHQIFYTREGYKSWLDFRTDLIDNNVLELTGLRLRTYIINNFGNQLYKGKYFSLWSKTEKSYKHYKNGYPVLKSRHSKALFDNECILTGMCYDMDLLDPIYKFLDKYLSNEKYHSTLNFDGLINDCFEGLKKSIDSEVEAQDGEDYIIEHIDGNEYEFLKNGKQFQ